MQPVTQYEKKPFDKDLYNKNDDVKYQLIEYLSKDGFDNPRVNPDQYGIDVLAELKNVPYAFEAEVKHNWKGKTFPFAEIHFPGRKIKFSNVEGIEQQNTLFVMFNHERTYALATNAKVLASSPVVAKKTIYTGMEQFVEISLNHVVFFPVSKNQ